MSPRHPDFLIVGAPKCGTTAMTRYLEAHPQVFMAARKDLHYFGSDLQFTRRARRTEAEYLGHFADAPPTALRAGEASVWYLASTRAAAEIHAFNPEMRIIIMLREPVSMMHALYTQLRLNGLGDEDLPTVEAALAAEPERARGRRLPPGTPLPQALLYRQAAAFSVQIERYQAVFPSDQLLVVLQDDLKADAAGTYRKTLAFLGVDADFEVDLRPVNSNKVVRSEGVRRLIAQTPASAKRLVPERLRRTLRKQIQRLNTRHEARAPLDPVLQKQLRAELRPEVERLSALIGRDLSAWLPR